MGAGLAGAGGAGAGAILGTVGAGGLCGSEGAAAGFDDDKFGGGVGKAGAAAGGCGLGRGIGFLGVTGYVQLVPFQYPPAPQRGGGGNGAWS